MIPHPKNKKIRFQKNYDSILILRYHYHIQFRYPVDTFDNTNFILVQFPVTQTLNENWNTNINNNGNLATKLGGGQ